MSKGALRMWKVSGCVTLAFWLTLMALVVLGIGRQYGWW